MKEETHIVYKDDYFGISFDTKEECSRFERFCSKVRVFPVEWETDFTEGKFTLRHKGDYILYCGYYDLDDIILPIIKYFMIREKGLEYGVVGGKFKEDCVLPNWRVLNSCFLGNQQFELTEDNILGIITNRHMYKCPSLFRIKDTICKAYKDKQEV